MGGKGNMAEKKKAGSRVTQLKIDDKSQKLCRRCTDSYHNPHTESFCPNDVPHLAASASSPSLLTGCGDPTTPTGANIESHILSHHVHANNPALSPRAQEVSSQMSFPSSPVYSPDLGDPPASVFLTPAPPRSRHLHERPSSAPPHHLERISGTLLRLVGDHYLCCTCGRQLRTIGDQLTLETNLYHAVSSGDLKRLQSDKD